MQSQFKVIKNESTSLFNSSCVSMFVITAQPCEESDCTLIYCGAFWPAGKNLRL